MLPQDGTTPASTARIATPQIAGAPAAIAQVATGQVAAKRVAAGQVAGTQGTGARTSGVRTAMSGTAIVPGGAPDRRTMRGSQPFRTAEEAWLWTIAALRARRDGARYTANLGLVSRPCEPDDVVRCLDVLYRNRRIDLVHARVLRVWGERQAAPSPSHATESGDFRLWREALERLEWPLRIKGIVG